MQLWLGLSLPDSTAQISPTDPHCGYSSDLSHRPTLVATAQISPTDPQPWCTAQISPTDPQPWCTAQVSPTAWGTAQASPYVQTRPTASRPTASWYKKLILVTTRTLVYTKTVETVTVETVVLTYH